MVLNKRGFLWRLVHGSGRMKIAFFFSLFFLQIAAYTFLFHYAYPILEEKPITWPAALLFVMETVTTTGYGELLPFQNQITVGITILMMLTGIILIFMIVPLLLVPYLSNLFYSTPPRKTPHGMYGHVVIIGFGELTKSLIDSLLISEMDMVIVSDSQDVARELTRKYGRRAFVVWGDYSNPATWANSWVRTASNVVVNEDEKITANVILGIREITRGRIIAVVDKLAFDRYLHYAGAEYVLSPKHVTGQILARHAALSSHVSTIVEETITDREPRAPGTDPGKTLRLVNIPVIPGSRAAGKRLGDLSLFTRYEIETLFLSQGGRYSFEPGDDDILDTSTMLFLLGSVQHIGNMMEQEFVIDERGSSLAVIAGFGDVGSAAYRELTGLGIDCVVIDQKEHPVSQVIGNAEDERILREAHVEEAQFCIVALNDDTLNIFTTLMARDLNPGIRILARANEPVSVDKLYRAGADYVALLPSIGGQVIGGVVLSDIVQVILNLPDGRKVVRKRAMKVLSQNIEWIEKKAGVKVIGIEGRNRSLVRPGPGEALQEGDELIAMGDTEGLRKFIRLL
ncbi:Trk K+ transport system NAD-binding subunit [Methanolinea mesophila]|uniref:potassium channel family protein n=1 Tax=Methanolinea mesophila TaxID=547055 RepID=UPI001AE29351|nr:NAD-binding protein [Methanolinea mesophila]MBP1929327.1 Trk K+ transport system NAD-binding subunit [Methanolinea mesophila]